MSISLLNRVEGKPALVVVLGRFEPLVGRAAQGEIANMITCSVRTKNCDRWRRTNIVMNR
eukprot:scaffold925_cov129-Cylindrotheca_fusiformis.AAC.21